MLELCSLALTGVGSLKLEHTSGFECRIWVSKVIHLAAIDTTSLHLLGQGCAPSSTHCLTDSRCEGDLRGICFFV